MNYFHFSIARERRTNLYKHLTAEETLRLFGGLLDLSGEQIKSRSEQLLDMVGLAHARKRRVGEFSHGMGRRLGLAQALLNDPDLVILDEPTAGMDPVGCREVKDLILALKKRGKTVLLTSQARPRPRTRRAVRETRCRVEADIGLLSRSRLAGLEVGLPDV